MEHVKKQAGHPLAAQKNIGVRRVFHGLERRYLSQEALGLASSLLESCVVPVETTETAIEQALLLGVASESEIDVSTFEGLVKALTLNPSFRVPFVFMPSASPWSQVC